jgi:putative restriction endonuclease
LLTETPEEYQQEIEKADEEEIYLRGSVFKRLVPRIYNYTCCISGLRIESTSGIQMIDACHIIPFSESHDDTITNGISLCPNLHRAFDRGLISIDENYRVVVSNAFVENDCDYSIKQFERKEIVLPQKDIYQPSRRGLLFHRKKWNLN